VFLGFGEKTAGKGWRYMVARLGEASTLRGGLYLLTAAGVAIRPEVGEAIIAAGMALAGLIGVLLPDAPTE
jgi:hypothetical protein